MKRFVEGESRSQSTLFPECLDDWIGDDNPVRAVDAFVEELDLRALGFGGAEPAATGTFAPGPGILAHQVMGVFGATYTEAVPALIVLLLYVLINAAFGSTGMMLLMTKHESLHTVALAVSPLAQVIGCFILPPPRMDFWAPHT